MKLYFCMALMFLGVSAEHHCALVPGWLTQIDAGDGKVYGVNGYDDIFSLDGNNWDQIPGKLTHVTVGHIGVWGVNRENQIFKMQDGNWVHVPGSLSQLDAGGHEHLVGVNSNDDIFCLNKDETLSKNSDLKFDNCDGKLIYYSCGPFSCWGVNRNNDIFHRLNVNSENCVGSEWRQVEGKFVMVEAGADGVVYGINTVGNIYKRQGICDTNPIGTYWSLVNIQGNYKHISYDRGIIWLINQEGNIFKCLNMCNQPASTSSESD